ncbi:uncharacterized protein LOC121386929 [Gigantopelta aegis]|uniref:uncharacterized protein LOC121386929 n=1 Tax=Gigantopelta aegis TaxID=1735272 RepID=UPI001B88BB85|nr:uncharacterized protein LOC121386929 [Gigantopelta aegis]
MWVAGLFTFKVVMLLYGLYLAWQVRNVTLPSMNDANPIIITSLTTMVMATFTSSVTTMLRAWPNAVYACVIFAIWFCNVVAMMAVFLPKVRQWKKTPDRSQFRVSIASGNMASGLQSFEQVEEELYHMVKENISLQKSLQDKNENIQVLQKHLDNAQEKLTQIKVNQEGKQDSGLDLSSSISHEDGCEITVLHKDHYNIESYESYMDMNGTITQSCQKAKRPSSLYSMASVASLSKLAKIRDAVVDDISQANVLGSNLRNSLSKDMDKAGKRRSWMYDSVRSRQELAGAIAKSYNLEDNCDTYSYVSSYLPSSSSLFHNKDPYHRHCSSDESLTTLANDRLYPECSKQRREERNQKRRNLKHDASKSENTVDQHQTQIEPPYLIESDAQSRALQRDTFV